MTRKRITAWVLLLFGLSAAALALPLLKERPAIPPPPPEEIPPFVLTRAFALRYDANVLRLALDGRCRMDREFFIVASAPRDRMDGRRELGLLAWPEDLGCPSIRIEDEARFKANLDRCLGQMVRERSHTPLPCLQGPYPGVASWMSLQMPLYRRDAQGLLATVDYGIHCGGHCGGGFRSTLRFDGHAWRLVRVDPTSLS